ncbi:MAG: CehA/McbA family metallohydrolase [Flavobacteriaceae bacterium]|nr:CehA/McbA family metallohydrolase [Flavobacteriaceae bacterium]
MKKLIILILIFNVLNIHSQNKKLKWFKGNTHVHTTLSGHADTHPDTVALWYLDRNWNFLILSEHNQFIDPKSINLPKNKRKDFILIPGVEVSDYYEIHTTGMNITREVFPHTITKENRFENYKTFLMQKHTDSIRGANGIPILNHPNWRSGASALQIEKVKGLHMLELYNGHPDVNNWGNKKHASMEQKWDSLLTAGKRFYGVSSDDAHFFKKWAIDESNPGRGWVMVMSKELSPDAITEAMANGEFYSSNGVILKKVDKSKKTYKVEIDVEASLIELQSDLLVGKRTDLEEAGFSIQFIGDKGIVLQNTNSTIAKFKIPKGLKYVRAKIIYSRVIGLKSEQFYAWTQPIFLNKH